MKNLITVAILISLGWYAYSKYQERGHVEILEMAAPAARSVVDSQFKCDGRTYCSQMTSCAEATYFLQNCPGTKMDGDNNGIPCEKQWCR